MTDNPKLWIGTPGEDDWRDVGKITDFQADAVPDDPVAFESFDPGAAVLPSKNEVTITTKVEPSTVDSLLEFTKKYIGSVTPEQEQLYRSLMVVGTRPVAHRHPGKRRWVEKRVNHARARRLYSERLRRDRRRKRAGRKPILPTTQVRALFPRVRVEHLERDGNALGMRVITSPHLDSGTVAMVDTELVSRHFMQEPPSIFSLKETAQEYLCTRYPYYDNPFKFTNLETS